MKKFKYLLIGLISLSLFSCLNEEGEGGTAVVQGRVFKVVHPDDIYDFKTSLLSETDSFRIEDCLIKADTFPAAKEDVYIVYGDEPVYGDKMEADYDGTYRFRYLVKGTYKVFAYSSYTNGDKEAVIDTVTVKNGEEKTAKDIYVHTGKSFQKSYIKGMVSVLYYDKNYQTGYIPGSDVRVYIRKRGAAYQFDEIRTGSDGTFVFQGIDPGVYDVYTLTEVKGYQILSPVVQTVTVPKTGVIVTIRNPYKIVINS